MSELNDNIRSFNALMRQYGNRWVLRLVDSHSDARNVLRNFGGMGSINDIYLCPENGNRIAEHDVASVNAQVHRLLSQIFEGCQEHIRRSVQ